MIQLSRNKLAVIAPVTTRITPSSTLNLAAIVEKGIRSRKFGFVDSFLPIYFFLRVIGFMPFSIGCEANGEVRKAQVSLLDGLWFVISICLYLGIAIYCSQNGGLPLDASYVLVMGDFLLLIVGFVYGAVAIAMDMFNRNRLVNIVNKFIIFDKEVNFEK